MVYSKILKLWHIFSFVLLPLGDETSDVVTAFKHWRYVNSNISSKLKLPLKIILAMDTPTLPQQPLALYSYQV